MVKCYQVHIIHITLLFTINSCLLNERNYQKHLYRKHGNLFSYTLVYKNKYLLLQLPLSKYEYRIFFFDKVEDVRYIFTQPSMYLATLKREKF
jgi:hypothetical protein